MVDAAKNNTLKWKILIVGSFAEDYLVKIVEEKVRVFSSKLIDWKSDQLVVWKKDDGKIALGANLPLKDDWGNHKLLPLFVCEKIDDFRNNGLKCPYEFVIERKDMFDGEGYKATCLLEQRIEVLMALNENGIDIDTFKDWMSGVMRKYLFLDDNAHGISGYIDPKDPNWDWGEWFKKETEYAWWRARFSDGSANPHDSLGHLKLLMKELWPKYFGDGECSLAHLPKEWDEALKDKLDKIYNIMELSEKDKNEGFAPLPLSWGDRARFVTPTGKIHVLLIDDDAIKSVLLDQERYRELNEVEREKDADTHCGNDEENRWQTDARGKELTHIDGENNKAAYKEAWRRFDQVFSVQPFELKPDDFPEFENRLREILKEHLSYDFALVDLCFGEDPGRDPLGYHVIKKLSKLFPHMPIVVYSRYKDMGHIMRAFQCGAMWFLRKGEEQKLARHLLDVVKKGSWKREWRAMQEYRPVKFVYNGRDPSFDDKFEHTDAWKYLTAKSLEFFPGKFIEVKKMGGGISTASTFSVQKGLILDGTPLQSPMIIKIDTAPNTRMEYERYFRYIRPYMANEAGRIERPSIIIDRNCSAIVYTFAGRHDEAHTLDSMKNMLIEDIVFKASCDYEKYRKAFDMIFDEILPRIHRVTPNREFGDGDENKDQKVFSEPTELDAKYSPGASFPNLQFGEVEEKDFYQTYSIRFPHFGMRELGYNAFDTQPKFKIEPDGSAKEKKLVVDSHTTHAYEFHDVWQNDDGSVSLEVYDLEEDRKPYFLTGAIATHVAKFRQRLYPGATLWVATSTTNSEDADTVVRIKMFDDDRVGKDYCKDWLEYANMYAASNENKGKSEEGKKDSPGRFYFDLVKNVLGFCKALYGDEIVKESDEKKREKKLKELYAGFTCNQGDSLFDVKEAGKFFEHIHKRFKCPLAICHGDLNYGNIMLESRRHPPKDEKPDVSQTVTDAWLIDFAKTRRDMIAHDFNVMFTDAFALLFDTRLFDADKNVKKEDKYETRLNDILPRFIRDVMFAENPNPPDYIEDDARFVFVYKILRRIRKAALEAGISEEMYTLTTVLECLLTLKLHLNKNMKNIRASAALFAVSKICFEQLCENVELDLLSMGMDGKTNKERNKS